MNIKSLLAALVLSLCLAAPVMAEWIEVTRCGASEGRSYYFSGGLVPKKKTGWTSDAISGGSTTLLTDGKDFDIIFKDAAQQTRSARFHDKATVFSRHNKGSPAGLTIVYIYYRSKTAFVSEQYTFQLDSRGNGVLLLSQQKDAVVSKSSLMAAKCSPSG